MLHIHDRTQRLGKIAPSLQTGLEGLFCEGHSASARATQEASHWLLELRRKEQWLACDCCGSGNEAPLLSPRQIALGRVVLVRHGRIAHSGNCAFHRMRPLGRTAPPGCDLPAPLLDLLVLDRESPDRSRRAFHFVMMRLLHSCGYGGVTIATSRVRRQAEASTSTHVDVPGHYRQVDMVGDVPVNATSVFADVSCTHPSGLRWLNANLLRCGHDGIFFGVVDEVDVTNLTVTTSSVARGSQTFRVRDALWAHGGGGQYWLLGRVAPGQDAAEIVCAYAHPLLSKRLLVPVDGAWERQVLEVLIERLHHWHERHRLDLTLDKPLITDALGHRPDFVLAGPAGMRVRVDAYAHSDDDYRAMREADIGPEEFCIAIDCSGNMDVAHLRQLVNAEVLRHASEWDAPIAAAG